uniref:Putative sensor with HAMP domain n=1 Tax=Geobacter sp. (strain M21) TaxID=443144 RepID=C6DY92_GEOSM
MLRTTTRKMFASLYLFSFLVVAAAIIFTVNYQQRAQALVEAQEKARLILDHNLAIHSYFSNQLKPRLFNLTDKNLPEEYFDPVWMSSTYAVREIDLYNKAFSKSDFYYKECAINARSPRNEADPVERAFLEEISKDPSVSVKSSIREIDGKPFFVVMRRGESMEKSCLRCHSTPAAAPADMVASYGPERSFSREDGELVSAISIRIPLQEAYANANKLSLKLSLLLLAILGVSSAAEFLAMHRMLLNPLTDLRDRTDAILRDESKLGQDIPELSRAEELKELTVTFNNLSRHLRREKDGLVEQVKERTAELESANKALEEDVRVREQIQLELAAKVAQLQEALAKVRTLEGILPICSYCKKIRTDEESWQQLEHYISEHSDALFSHGVCPSCFHEVQQGFKKGKQRDTNE